MTYEEKLSHATALLRHFPSPQALMCSFGKDSMVLLHLIKNVLTGNELRSGAYPIPIIWHKHPWFPAKNEFAESIVCLWNLEVYDSPPIACGIKAKADMLELVARYPFGGGAMDLPINTEQSLKRREFVCGLQWLERPKSSGMQWPWVTVFIGHKDSDVDPYEGNVPLKHDAADAGGVNLVFPLRHWTDDDVWQYIEENNVPFDKRRYAGRLEVPDHTLNPDYINACSKCIDPREDAKEVLCPKLNKMVPNLSRKVLRLEGLPDYVKKENHALQPA